MKQIKRPLRVTVDVEQPSTIELTVDETIRLDRVRNTERGIAAEQHGALIGPGTSTLALDPGQFVFKTMSDAQLRVIQGGARIETQAQDDIKWPDSGGDEPSGDQPALTVSPKIPMSLGDEPTGDQPTLTVA